MYYIITCKKEGVENWLTINSGFKPDESLAKHHPTVEDAVGNMLLYSPGSDVIECSEDGQKKVIINISGRCA